MFFDSMKRRTFANVVSDEGDRAASQVREREAHQWSAWRRSAQKVTRAWNGWLAADARQRAELYQSYVSALSDEERAAVELERACAAS